MNNWLERYIEYVDQTESPIEYHLWTAISILAAAIERKVYLQFGHSRLFCNCYIILIGPPGIGKGIAMSLGSSLLHQLGTVNMAPEDVTREEFIRMMASAQKGFQDKKGHEVLQNPMTCFSEELIVFLHEKDVKFLGSLTNLYDNLEYGWTYATKNKGTDHLVGAWFNLLGGMAPDWMPVIFPQDLVGTGFLSRSVLVVANAKAKVLENPQIGQREELLRKSLMKDLLRVHQTVGTIAFSPSAQNFYGEWYREHERQIALGNPPVHGKNFAGYCNRKKTHLQKISMILAIARSRNFLVEKEDVEEALGYLNNAETKMEAVFSHGNKNRLSEIALNILSYISREKIVLKEDILRKFMTDISIDDLTLIERGLIGAGYIKKIKKDKKPGYEIIERGKN